MKSGSADGIDAGLLATFEAAGAGYVSGTELARQFGMSRPAVWARIQKLQAEGFVFEAVRNRGYRLTGRPPGLHAAALKAALGRGGIAAEVWVLEEIDSTNLEVDRLLAAGATGPLVVAARRQLLGRGRLGRVWESGSPENIYLSVGLQPDCAAELLAGFTLRVGLSLAEALNAAIAGSEGGVGPVQVKWPNDLIGDGRKLGGILTEAKIEADTVRSLVIGVGLNRGSHPDGQQAVSLRELFPGGALPEPERCALWIVAAVRQAAERLNDHRPEFRGGDPALPERFARLDCLAGRAVTVRRGERVTEGIAAGVTPQGSLRLLEADGKVLAIHSGDATLAAYG